MKQVFAFRHHYQKAKAFHSRYEKLLMPLLLGLGFLVDYLTFITVSIPINLGILVGYWVVVALGILFITFYDEGKIPLTFARARVGVAWLVQFSLGSLLGGSLVFYWFSGVFSVSWPFIIIIVCLMVLSDAFRHYFSKPMVQLGVYFFTTLSVTALMLPYVVNSISSWLFIAASGVSLLLFFVYGIILSRISKSIIQQRREMVMMVLAITIGMNVLYFANIIPPIPLSIREAGVYHRIIPSAKNYTMFGEPETFWQTILPGQTVHLQAGERVYVYTAIFAPASLNTTIIHHWQRYSESSKKWIDMGKLPFTVLGGRNEGYKGYSWTVGPASGVWRVDVETTRGQVLGRINFTVERVAQKASLYEIIR